MPLLPTIGRAARFGLVAFCLLQPLAAPAKNRAHAPDGILRIGIEGGAAWLNAFPSQGLGFSGGARLRAQLTERLMPTVALLRLSQDFGPEIGLVETTLVPLTLDLRLDRAPLSPFVGAGVALAFVQSADPEIDGSGRAQLGGVFEAGLEWYLSERLSASAQVTYAGLGNGDEAFPYFSTASLGLAFSL